MRKTLLTLAALAIVAPLGAQTQQGKDKDPTKTVANAPLPAGWARRYDKASGGSAKFVTMSPGYHVTAGDAAIYYNAKDTASGAYTVSAKFSQTTPSGHEGYGIFVGGANLQGPTQSYIYFLVRPSDGYYLINHRAGADVHKIIDWTASPAMNAQDASGKSTNQLAVRVTKDSVQFTANGKPVKGFSKADMKGFNVGGQAGLRINHNLDLHIVELNVTRGK